MKNIAVIGAGTMGNGIAHTFAQYNYNVNLIDISQNAIEKGMATINKKPRPNGSQRAHYTFSKRGYNK